MLHPNTKSHSTKPLGSSVVGGHTSTKWLHPGFPLGVSSQGPPREPSVGPAHHTLSPSHLQLARAEEQHTQRGNPEHPPLPALPSFSGYRSGSPGHCSPHLRSVLSAREMAGFLTALLQAALLLWERCESQCLPPGSKRSGSPSKCCPTR